MSGPQFEPILIRYDGLDAAEHQIELSALGQSLQGASRLIGISANFIITGQYVKKAPALDVRVLAQESKGGCYEVIATIMAVSPPALPFITQMGSAAVEHVVNYILAKFGGKPDHMNRMMDLLETAHQESGQTSRAAIEAMRSTVDTLANAQRPAARQFVTPVGETCATTRIGSITGQAIEIDKPMKDAIIAPDEFEVSEETAYTVLISELDMQTGSCKVSVRGVDDAEHRYASEITDPSVKLPNNPYALAMSAKQWIVVQAKGRISQGELEKLYISNTSE